MYNIVLFTKTTDFYIEVIKKFFRNFIISVVVINKKSDLNTKYINYIRKKNIPILIHPFKKNKMATKKFINDLKYYNIDYIFTVFYPQILTKDIINVSKYNSFNFHPGKLPTQRGAHILNWLIIENVKESCVTLHKLEEEIDAGKILYEEKYIIYQEDTINDIIEKTNKKVLNIIEKLKNLLKKGDEKLYENEGKNKYYKPRSIKDSEINLDTYSIQDIYNMNRALIYPYPGIYWYKNGLKFTNNRFVEYDKIEKMINF